MKKYLVAALAMTATAAVAAAAAAQYQLPGLTFDARVTPAKSGTKKKPKNAKIRLKLAIPKEARLTADQLVFNLPKHVRASGRGFKFCPSTRLDTTKDPAKCPKGSKVGEGTASAAFGPNLLPINFDVTVFAGSRTELGIWFEGTNLPLAKALRGVISRAGSPYHQKLTIDVPPQLHRYLGAYVYLTGFDTTIGAANGRKGKRRAHAVSTIGCPKDGRHRFEARLRFVPNPNPATPGEVAHRDSSTCR